MKKNAKITLLSVISVLLIIAIALGIFFIVRNKNKNANFIYFDINNTLLQIDCEVLGSINGDVSFTYNSHLASEKTPQWESPCLVFDRKIGSEITIKFKVQNFSQFPVKTVLSGYRKTNSFFSTTVLGDISLLGEHVSGQPSTNEIVIIYKLLEFPASLNLDTDLTLSVKEIPYTNENLFTFNESTKTITGCKSYKEDLVIPRQINFIDVENINIELFSSEVKYISFPSGVKSIKNNPDFTFNKIESLDLPSTIETLEDGFFANSILSFIHLPNSIKSIGNKAFLNCVSLTNISLPDSVTSIGASAFYGCSNLKSVKFSNGISSIKEKTFYNCTKLKTFYISNENNSLTDIGNEAFNNCQSLTAVSMPDSVTSIGTSAFMGCISLTAASLPDSVTSIGSSAFSGCSNLKSVKLPDGILSINENTFYNCNYLTSIYFSDNNIFEGLILPSSVTSIETSAFKYCYGIQNVTIPASVTNIGTSAFERCSGIKIVTIPASVTNIGTSAFEYCRGINTVTIPASVENIGENAFYYCSGLSSVYFERTSIFKSLRWNCFSYLNENSSLYFKNSTVSNQFSSSYYSTDRTTKALY